MSDKISERPEQPTGVEVTEPVSEADKLIAELDQAAQEAQSSGARAEAGKIETKKRAKAKAIEETEELQQRFTALKSDDNFVEECAYEWAFDALGNETGVAAPEGIHEKITALRKTGDALRKIVGIEPKTKTVLDKIDELQKLHDKLFEEIKTAAVDALEEVKKKHKGEESDFAKKFKELIDSPLVKLVEYDPNSPEEREKGLKQEITEFLLRPVVDGRLTNLEKVLAETREKITKSKKQETELKNDYVDDASWNARQAGMRVAQGQKVSSADLKNWVAQEIRNSEKLVISLETQLSRERLALSVNRLIIDESLADEHDETILKDALVAIRDHVGTLRKRESDVSWDFWRDKGHAPLKNPLAQKILGQYGEFTVSFPDNYALQASFGPAYRKLTPAGQIIGKDWETHPGIQGTAPAKLLNSELPVYFFRSQIPEMNREFIFVDNRENMFGQAREFYARTSHELSADERKDPKRKEYLSQQAEFLAKYPTVGDFVAKVFAGKGKLLNLRLAHEKVDAGISKDQYGQKSEFGDLSKELSAAGWKKSKLGAFVEPGQNAREVDGEHARLLGQLSAPQIEAERAFDVRGPDGEFHVYTTEQAVRIAGLLKRDAQGIIRDYEAAVTRAAGDKAQAEDLQTQARTLDARLQEMKEAARASAQRIGQLTRENDSARSVIDESERRARQSADEADHLRRENQRLAEVVRGAVGELKQARREKPGLLGGAGKLQAAIDTALGELGKI
ncbi:MAG: hypothetical protein HZC26_04170 [Candidatus Magasanikbacteria bacterium]|nr:hypothetical protein [Candidatus Magasanikbacteria bacterium]